MACGWTRRSSGARARRRRRTTTHASRGASTLRSSGWSCGAWVSNFHTRGITTHKLILSTHAPPYDPLALGDELAQTKNETKTNLCLQTYCACATLSSLSRRSNHLSAILASFNELPSVWVNRRSEKRKTGGYFIHLFIFLTTPTLKYSSAQNEYVREVAF